MRSTIFGSMMAVIFALAAAAAPVSTAHADDPPGQTVLAIKGMTCGGCVGAIKAQLKKTKGVIEYEVSLEKAEAEVTFDPSETDPETIAASISKTGMEARVKGDGGGGHGKDEKSG